MSDSLIIDGVIELLGGGVPSTVPQCLGAIFYLAKEYDFGEPQPQTDVVGSLVLDGERPYGRRSGNRTITLPIIIQAPNRAMLAGAREVLMRTIDQDKWTLTWTREDGFPLVFDCFRAKPSSVQYNLTRDKQLVATLTITFEALPYGRSDEPLSLTFASPAVGSSPPPAPVVIDYYETVTHPFWYRSTKHVCSPYSARWDYGAYDFSPDYTETFSIPVNVTDRTAFSFYFGLGAQDYWNWSSGNVSFSVTLTDVDDRTLTFGTTKKCWASNDTENPNWHEITATIPSSSNFSFNALKSYRITCYAYIDKYNRKHLPCAVYIHYTRHNPVTIGTPVSNRGSLYTLYGIQGTARSPLSLQFQQTGLATFKTLIVHRPGAEAPQSLVPFVNVGDAQNPPDGRAYSVTSQGSSVKPRFNGTYTVVASNYYWDTPSVARTLTVTVKQYAYSPDVGLSTATLTRTFTPNTDIKNGLVVLGELTLPVKDLAEDNTESYFTICVTDSNTYDRYLDVLFLDTTGQTVMINSSTGYANFYIDEPDTDRDLGRILGSQSNRSRAISVLDQMLAMSGGPLMVTPGDNTLLCYSVEGAPALVASYKPRWFIDRLI